MEDDVVKVRGIEFRRHDTPGIVANCQAGMLRVFSRARNSFEFRELIPEALSVLKNHVERVRKGLAPLEDLVIAKNLSKAPEDYSNLVPQAVAALLLTGGMTALAVAGVGALVVVAVVVTFGVMFGLADRQRS